MPGWRERIYETGSIYLYFAIEINVARTQACQLSHCKHTVQERFLRLSFVNDDSVGIEPNSIGTYFTLLHLYAKNEVEKKYCKGIVQ